MNEAEADYLRCLQQGVIAFVKGSAPALAIEFARRSLPSGVRPSFQDTEAACKGGRASAAPAEQAA